jgi:hypothetical protein
MRKELLEYKQQVDETMEAIMNNNNNNNNHHDTPVAVAGSARTETAEEFINHGE